MQILLKALMTLPNADFIMCRCLIDDANVSFLLYLFKIITIRTVAEVVARAAAVIVVVAVVVVSFYHYYLLSIQPLRNKRSYQCVQRRQLLFGEHLRT